MRGAWVGRWELVAELARGGSGSVWRARDEAGREVALKLLLAGQDATPAQRGRFLREAQALVRLRHPHVVQVLDAGEDQGAPFLAMELVEGESLAARLAREGPLPPREAAELVRRLALGLAHAHAQGVLHRDLKPANVLLRPDGRPVLTDFGLTRDVDPTSSQGALTVRGRLMGTPGYWAPEQAEGDPERVGVATDVWGLGATLYALLTGQPPHGEPDSLPEALAALERDPPAPGSLRPGLDPRLEAICMRCLARDPVARWATAEDLAGALEAWLRPSSGRALGRWAALLAGAALLPLGPGGSRRARPGPAPPPCPSPSRGRPGSRTRPATRPGRGASWRPTRGCATPPPGATRWSAGARRIRRTRARGGPASSCARSCAPPPGGCWCTTSCGGSPGWGPGW